MSVTTHNYITVPPKYVIDQQDIEISKNCMFKTQKKLARSLRSLVIIYKFLVFQTQGYYCTDKICDSPTRYRDLEELYGLRRKMRKCLARSLRSLVIIYDISQVLTLLIKAIS